MSPAELTSPPRVESEEFSGPLDLLLDEVRRQNVSIEKVAMAPMVARFLEYVRTARGRSLNLDIEWLHMAATLIHWKSRVLLPAAVSDEPAADPIRDELIQQLVAHRREAAAELGRRRSQEAAHVSRGPRGDGQDREGEAAEVPAFSVWEMIQQARELARWVEQYRQDVRQVREIFGVERDSVTVGEMTEYLRGVLRDTAAPIDGVGLLAVQPSADHRSCLFLGMLEMVRAQELDLQQNEALGPMWLRLRTAGEPAARRTWLQ